MTFEYSWESCSVLAVCYDHVYDYKVFEVESNHSVQV